MSEARAFLSISYVWVDPVAEARHRACMIAVFQIQERARKEAEPFLKLAADLHSVGARPVLYR